MPSLVGQLLGRYRLLDVLGRGGTADIYLAQHPDLDRYVAIKVLRSDTDEGAGLAQRFEREANAVAQLRHPRIVQLYDFVLSAPIPYMVMELINGPSLHAELRERRQQQHPLPLTDVARLGLALAEAIDYAHGQGVIHRDLKPGNILFTAEGQVRLSDFGLVRHLGDIRRTATGVPVGTPAYMSPEQSLGELSDTRSDIYALGVILYEMATHQLPFEANHIPALLLQIIQEEPLPPSARRAELSPQVDAILLQALQKDRNARPASAGELARAFARAVKLSPTGALDSDLRFPLICPPRIFQPPTSHDLALAQGLTTAEWLHTPASASELSTASLPPASHTPPRPFQVPSDVAHFVGRQALIAELIRALTQATEAQIVALCGLGGIGKTTLAHHIAHTLRPQFADGMLWANLANSEPLAILNGWARALGYDFSGLRDVDSRAAALRGVLVERRVLLIVDDVWEAGAARALLVGGPASATLLTTRNLDLAVALGAQVVSLPVLALDESLQLFRRILGPKRVEAEAQAAADIAQLLMHHPLALEIAARRLVSRPRWQLADLAERLRDEKQRLNELSIGDKAVRASFTISWEALDPILRQTFTHLAVFEGRAFTAPALAAVAELDKRQAADRLGLLAALSWVTEEGTVHYRQHLLLADFARERLSQDPAESAASFIRMADYYLQFARKRPTAYAELEAEWDNLTAGMRVAHEHGQWQTVLDYADALNGPWFTRGHFSDARQGYARACAAARALNDQHALAQQLCLWGRACIEQSDYAEAEEYLKESLGIGRLFTEQALAGDALYYLGWLEAERANYSTSQAHLQASRAIREQLGDSAGIAATLHREAKNYYELGQYAEAKHLGQRVLDNAAAVQIKTHIKTLRVLADVHMAEKDYIQAEALSQTALQLCEASQDRIELALVLYSLATIAHYQNLASVAQTYAERSLEIFIRIGDRKSQAQVLYLLGANYADQGDYAGAFKVGQHSLQLCQELEDVWGMIYVRLFLGGISKQLHDPAGAHAQWQIALTQAEGLTASHPLVETLRERLTSLV